MPLRATVSLQAGVDLGHRVGDVEAHQPGRGVQALGMLGQLVDGAAVDTLALEHAARIVQPVAEHVKFRVAPGGKCAVEPDFAVAVVVGKQGHGGQGEFAQVES